MLNHFMTGFVTLRQLRPRYTKLGQIMSGLFRFGHVRSG